MLVLVKRGAVTDRPWGITLAGFVGERITGELVVIADGKRFSIAFNDGAIVGALSPGVADSVGRIALTSHLVSSTQVAEITRRIAAQPERDEIEVIAEVARLSATQADTLRRRVITQRAARTFAIEQGTFALDPDGKTAVPELSSVAIDVRTIIYLGARMHVPETRLTNELRQLGSRFVMQLEAMDELGRFGFTEVERPVVEALRSGSSIAELEATHRELDPRMIAAVIYTLACCGACSDTSPARSASTNDDVRISRTMTPVRNVNQRVTTKERQAMEPLGRPPEPAPLAVSIPTVSRTMTPPPRATTSPGLAQGSSPSLKRASVMIPPLDGTRAAHRAPTQQPAVSRTLTPEKLDARDAFQRGEMAMRREQIGQAIVEFARAVELQPDSADYVAMLAWAKFCAAMDKSAIADETRRMIDKAMRSSESVVPRLCLGRVERMLGRDREAVKYFQQVLDLQPRHSAAASELRVLEARLRR